MPATSRLARLQQAIIGSVLLLAAAWLAAAWPLSPIGAVAGTIAILFVHVPLLGLEFLLLLHFRRGDPAPRAGAGQLLAAWLQESVTGLQVFGWRQPFRWRRWPDSLNGKPGCRGIVFIHGFVCNRGLWSPWLIRARTLGHPFVAVNLEPVFGSIDEYTDTIDAAVRLLEAATGLPPVLVCHSMGGLAARAWLRRRADPQAVARVITIGTPHHGTALARFSRVANGRQMREKGQWLQGLGEAHPAALPSLFTCWYSNCDNIVAPPSTATLPGADNRLVVGAAHVDLAFRPAVMDGTFALVQAL